MSSTATKKVVGATLRQVVGGAVWWELLSCGHLGQVVKDWRGKVEEKQAKTRLCRKCAHR